jgi:hypothetical protein
MNSMSTPPLEQVPIDAKTRRWALHVITLLLFLQAAGLLAVSIYYATLVDWGQEYERWLLSNNTLEALLLIFLFMPLAIVGTLTAVGFLFVQRGAWLRAMIVQGLLLIFCLSSYFSGHREPVIFLTMVICIVLVLYLNTNDIRLTFYAKKPQRVRSKRRT